MTGACANNRVAVLGTYRSGTSAVAGVLHFLGVDMGQPYFGDHFESIDLSLALRRWWCEPKFVRSMSSSYQVQHLRSWIESRREHPLAGAKHPILSLCTKELVEAWGNGIRFVWCQRPIDDAIRSLDNAGWWSENSSIQNRLNDANLQFFREYPSIIAPFSQTKEDPEALVQLLVESLGLEPAHSQIEDAMRWLKERRLKQPIEASLELGPESGSSQRLPIVAQKIVATILSGNAEDLVSDAVQSVVEWVDEVCLIDTGITDNTHSRVRSIAGCKFVSDVFEWQSDFSAARNAALQIARNRGATWALTLDTDERIVFQSIRDIGDLKNRLNALSQVDAWLVESGDRSYSKERFLRTTSLLQWNGKTHEALVCAAPFHRRVLDGCFFWEEIKSKTAYEEKIRRDLKILRDQTAGQPLNPRWWYYLGQTYEGIKDFSKAIEYYDRCIRLDGWSAKSGWACYTAARCLVHMQAFREAEEYCALGMTRTPASAELPWLAGWCCFQRGELDQSIAWSRIAIAVATDKNGLAMSFRHVPAWYEGPYDVLRHAFRKRGNLLEAEKAELLFTIAKSNRIAFQESRILVNAITPCV